MERFARTIRSSVDPGLLECSRPCRLSKTEADNVAQNINPLTPKQFRRFRVFRWEEPAKGGVHGNNSTGRNCALHALARQYGLSGYFVLTSNVLVAFGGRSSEELGNIRLRIPPDTNTHP